jgi:hypothetical protein
MSTSTCCFPLNQTLNYDAIKCHDEIICTLVGGHIWHRTEPERRTAEEQTTFHPNWHNWFFKFHKLKNPAFSYHPKHIHTISQPRPKNSYTSAFEIDITCSTHHQHMQNQNWKLPGSPHPFPPRNCTNSLPQRKKIPPPTQQFALRGSRPISQEPVPELPMQFPTQTSKTINNLWRLPSPNTQTSCTSRLCQTSQHKIPLDEISRWRWICERARTWKILHQMLARTRKKKFLLIRLVDLQHIIAHATGFPLPQVRGQHPSVGGTDFRLNSRCRHCAPTSTTAPTLGQYGDRWSALARVTCSASGPVRVPFMGTWERRDSTHCVSRCLIGLFYFGQGAQDLFIDGDKPHNWFLLGALWHVT